MPTSAIPSVPAAPAVWRALRRARTLTFFACLLSIAATSPLTAQVNVTTYHNDVSRTGWNPDETILTPANVNSNTFGLLFSYPVDGFVYAQPLALSGVTLQHQKHNLVFIASEHNSVYAFDADYPFLTAAAPPLPLWHVNLGPSVPSEDVRVGDIVPEIGITSTPVIDVRTGTLYVVAKTKERDGAGNPIYVQRLHALNVATGKEKLGGPVIIQGFVPGTGDGSDGVNVAFNPLIQHNRPGLLEGTIIVGGLKHTAIYIAYASHGDKGPYHGWLFAYDAQTLKQLAIFNTSPDARTDPSGYPIAAGGIWQGGGGLAWDGSNVYYMTGNGTFNISTDPTVQSSYGDAFVKMSTNGGLNVASYFVPSNQLHLDNIDGDLGSGGVMLLPNSVGSKRHPGLLIGAGKDGTIYLLDRKSLGGYNATDDVVQEILGQIGGIWGMPAYFNGSIYFGATNDAVKAFSIANAQMSMTPTSQSPTSSIFPGPTPSVSSNNTTNGIVWAIQTDAYVDDGPAILHAYDATNLGNELYRSDQTSNRDTPGGAVKFVTPTIANGKVFVGTQYAVSVYGQGQWAPAPAITPTGETSSTTITGITISDAQPDAKIYYTTDGSLPTQNSTLYTGVPISVSSCTAFLARAYVPGYCPSAVTEGDFIIGIEPGTGTGLFGDYFDNMTLTAPDANTRIDPTIDFRWGGKSPIAGVGRTHWSARWTGTLTAEYTGNYTLTLVTHDGARLYLDGKELINAWYNQLKTAHIAHISMIAGTQHSITVEYYQDTGSSWLRLFWTLPGIPRQIIPQTQLTPQ